MQIDDLRNELQGALDQDFDALYNKYVEDAGPGDVRGFIAHIHGFGHINDATYDRVMGMAEAGGTGPSIDETPPPPPWNRPLFTSPSPPTS